MSDAGPMLCLVTPDLFLGSRIRGIAERAGYTVVSSPKLSRVPDAVGSVPTTRLLIDLAAPGASEVTQELLRAFSRTAAYAPHVRVDLLKAARAAGIQQVWTRSQLETELPAWLAE